MWLQPAIRLIAGAAARVYYRLEVAGPRPPASGPALLVANHPNGLLDPALVIVAARRRIRFLAKSTLFSDPRLGWLVRGAGAIPVYRRMDDPGELGRNVDTFEAVFEALGRGDAVGIFPEGVSHSRPALGELKTGAARMVLGTYERYRQIVPIVPIGLVFRRKDAFRSEALALLGEPVPWDDLAARGDEDRDAVHELTGRIGDGLRRLTVNLESWEDAPLVEWAEAIWAAERETYDDPAEELARKNEIARVLTGLRRQREAAPEAPTVERAAEISAAISLHRRRMSDLGLEPVDLADPEHVHARPLSYRMLDPLSALIGGIGYVLFWVPWWLTGRIAALARPSPETRSTYHVLIGFLVYLAWVAGLSGLGGLLAGWPAALGIAIGMPAVGLLGLWARERRREQRRVWRKVSRALSRRETVNELEAAQAQIADQLEQLYQGWRSGATRVSPSAGIE